MQTKLRVSIPFGDERRRVCERDRVCECRAYLTASRNGFDAEAEGRGSDKEMRIKQIPIFTSVTRTIAYWYKIILHINPHVRIGYFKMIYPIKIAPVKQQLCCHVLHCTKFDNGTGFCLLFCIKSIHTHNCVRIRTHNKCIQFTQNQMPFFCSLSRNKHNNVTLE